MIKTSTVFRSNQFEFKLNERFTQKRMDGKQINATMRREANKLIENQELEPPIEIVREFFADKMVSTCKSGDIINVRQYRRVSSA